MRSVATDCQKKDSAEKRILGPGIFERHWEILQNKSVILSEVEYSRRQRTTQLIFEHCFEEFSRRQWENSLKRRKDNGGIGVLRLRSAFASLRSGLQRFGSTSRP